MFTLISTALAVASFLCMCNADYANRHPGNKERCFTPAVTLLILAILSAVPLGFIDGHYGIKSVGNAINFIGGIWIFPMEIFNCTSLPKAQAKRLKILAYIFSIAGFIGTAFSLLF